MAEGIYIAMGIRVFGVRGSKGTSTEQGITVALRNSMHSCPVTEIPEKQEDLRLKMEKQRMKTFRMVFLAMMVAIGVVISPILRIEGMCPTAHLINITCSVFMGPWYSPLCACMIGVIRMMFMGIPPLALTGAVFGAFLSGVFYRASKGKIICAVFGEIFGTGIIGSLVSYPVMAFLMGREGLNAFYYTPMFISATIMGGIAAYVFLKALSQTGMLAKFQESLGAKVYDKNHRKSAEGADTETGYTRNSRVY